MSQFDFPRINFVGEAIISPPTANNNSFFPLVLFDPVKVKAFMPPRIYLSEKLMRIYSLGLLTLPEDTPILNDEDNGFYFEINTVNSQQVFKQWATTPLGASPFDSGFHPIYNLIRTTRDNQSLAGKIPCYWNYFGGLDFRFSTVTVTSIEVPAKGNGSIYYTIKNANYPPDIEHIIDATVELKGDKDKSTAVIVNVNPSMPYYAQIFCDLITIGKNGKIFLKGKPCKASSRFLNLGRIVNQEGAIAGSGTFYCIIPLSDLEEGVHAPVMQFFEKYHLSNRTIAGVFIRYNLFEVKEDQNPDYNTLCSSANPARCSILGSITPWYEHDLKSITMGRQLIPGQPYLEDRKLPPIVFRVDKERKVIEFDMIGGIPEIYAEAFYQTYDLGELSIKCRTNNHEIINIGTITVNQQQLSRNKIVTTGGLINIPYSENMALTDDVLENGLFLIYGISKKNIDDEGTNVLLMRESDFMVASDQAGLYINQHDDQRMGYMCYRHEREPCKITIYHKGKPLEGVLRMTIKELSIRSVGALPYLSTFVENKEFTNGQELEFSSLEAANVLYVFYPNNSEDSNNVHEYILDTGFFISLRVLPKHDYSKYLSNGFTQNSAPITFELLYEEILKVYDLIYPSSAIITPFTEEYFRQAWKYIKQRLSPENWSSASYMPSSRDMSFDQWQLLSKWAEKVN